MCLMASRVYGTCTLHTVCLIWSLGTCSVPIHYCYIPFTAHFSCPFNEWHAPKARSVALKIILVRLHMGAKNVSSAV